MVAEDIGDRFVAIPSGFKEVVEVIDERSVLVDLF